jgi:hypothetical protein
VTDASTFSGNSPSLSSIVNQAPASFLSNIGAMKKNADKETKSADSAVTDMKDIEAKGEKAAAATGALTPPNLQPFNPPQGTDPVKAFGSTASILAVFGGLLTKRPLTTSLNAVAGVVNAYKRNDAAAADAAFKEWKVNTDNAIKLHEFQMDAYKQIMDSTSMSLREKEAEVSVTAHALGDSNSALIAENQGLAGFVDHFDKMQGQGAKLAEDKIKLEGLNEVMKTGAALKAAKNSRDPNAIAAAQQASEAALADYKKIVQSTDPAAMTAGDKASEAGWQVLTDPTKKDDDGNPVQYRYKAGTGEATTLDLKPYAPGGASKIAGGSQSAALSDDAADLIADQVIAGNRQAATGLARNAANVVKVGNAIAAKAKKLGMSGADLAALQAEYQGTVQGERTLATRTTNMEIAANEVKNMAPIALSASKQVDRSEYPDLNTIIIAADRGTGDENVVRFGLAANSLIYTYSKFLNPNGIPTDADKAKATDILSTAWSKGQFSAAIDQIGKEIASGRAALKTTRGELRNQTTGNNSSTDNIPFNAPTASDTKGNKIYWDGQGWKPASKDSQ